MWPGASLDDGDADGDDVGFEVQTLGPTQAHDRTAFDWARSEGDMPPLPQKLTGAQTSIRAADELLETMAGSVRGHLARIDELLAGAD